MTFVNLKNKLVYKITPEYDTQMWSMHLVKKKEIIFKNVLYDLMPRIDI